MTGTKHDGGKPRMSLLPWRAIQAVVKVLEFGAKIYGVGNWLKVENARIRYFDAALRHLIAWYNGEENDPQSGLPHLAHAACCVLFLLNFEVDPSVDKSKFEDRRSDSEKLEASIEIGRLKEIELLANTMSQMAEIARTGGGTFNLSQQDALDLFPRHLFDPAAYAEAKRGGQ